MLKKKRRFKYLLINKQKNGKIMKKFGFYFISSRFFNYQLTTILSLIILSVKKKRHYNMGILLKKKKKFMANMPKSYNQMEYN